MVKPIFPSSRCEANEQLQPGFSTVNHNENVLTDGESFNASYMANSWAANEDSVFLNSQSFGPQYNQPNVTHLQSFQSYDGSFASTSPAPAPRERISSHPDHAESEIRPSPRERRRSAPVGISFAHSDGASSASQNGGDQNLPPALHDIAVKGVELFWFILSEECKVQETASPGRLNALTIPHSPQRMEVLNERGRFGGRTLRQTAEAFSNSSHRMRVKEYAESVHLQSLNYNSFSDLLFGLFQEGGITEARVLVLFFFCADLALRALRENLTKHFQLLVDWTSRYITEKLSAWVHENGGWAAVLQESMGQVSKLAVIGGFVLGAVILTTLLLRKF